MAWPYQFVDLTDAQKLERRQLLDKYANIAQISALVPLLVIQVYFVLWHLTHDKTDGKKEHHGDRVGIVQKLWRKFSWWCGEPIQIGSLHSGSRGETLMAVGWLSWLLFLCFPETGDDYLHLTKRFGIVAASQLPLHYMLSMKTSYSPLQILTRQSHETLNTFHQLLGRVILTLLYLHVSFYLNFYIQKDLLISKLQETYILCGLAAIISLTILGTTALAPIRQRNYRLFFGIHLVVALGILGVLPFHVSHIRIYIYEAAALFVLNAVLREKSARKAFATLKRLPDTNLMEVNLRLSSDAEDTKLRQTTQPGQHAYLALTEAAGPRKVRSNPFSVSSIPSTDGQIRFIARVLDGNTKLLNDALGSFRVSNREIAVEGPYGVDHTQSLLQYDRVLFVAGGIGGTFIVPLYRQLLADLSPSPGSSRRQKVTFVWIAQKMADVTWTLPADSKEREGFAERLQVYLTKDGTADHAASNASITNNEQDRSASDIEDGIELEERKNLLASDSDNFDSKGSSGLPVQAGRPDLKKVVSNTMSQSSHERVAVLVCGPESLSQAIRAELHKYGARGRDIFYWEEKFAM